MNTRRTWRSAVCAVIGLVVAGASLTFVTPAQAATVGTLTLSPATGAAFTALTVTTNTGCPASATDFMVTISGGSLGSTPSNVNGDAALSSIQASPGQTSSMSVPLAKVLDQVRSDAGLTSLSTGTYTLAFVCRKKLNSTSLGDLVGTFSITKAMTASSNGAYVAVIPGAPTNSKLPTVTGTAKVGAKLTCSKGTWGGSPTSYTYRWLRNGASIAGATKTTYTLAGKDYKKSVSCQVTAKNAKGSTPAVSKAKKVALGAKLVATTKPVIKGTAKVGHKLTISHGKWKPAATSYSYVWKVGTKVVSKSSSYTPKSSVKGKKVTVTVTAKALGHANGVATTKAVTVK